MDYLFFIVIVLIVRRATSAISSSQSICYASLLSISEYQPSYFRLLLLFSLTVFPFLALFLLLLQLSLLFLLAVLLVPLCLGPILILISTFNQQTIPFRFICKILIIHIPKQILSYKILHLLAMKQFKTKIYPQQPPFATCLFHKDIHPEDETFLQMIKFTFFPYFQLYSFTFFWFLLSFFVYVYSLTRQSIAPINTQEAITQNQLLKVSQSVLFQLGQNYPYYIVNKFHYYRLLTSMVLYRNLYHFLVGCIGIIIFGSYIQQLVGFKRVFLLSIISGLGGQLMRNLFVYKSSIESLTPINGMAGYLIGLYIAYGSSKWKYNTAQKMHMLLVIAIPLLLYYQLSYYYSNISSLSMLFGSILGLVFYFCDPIQKYQVWRMPCMILLCGCFGLAVFIGFVRLSMPLMDL